MVEMRVQTRREQHTEMRIARHKGVLRWSCLARPVVRSVPRNYTIQRRSRQTNQTTCSCMGPDDCVSAMELCSPMLHALVLAGTACETEPDVGASRDSGLQVASSSLRSIHLPPAGGPRSPRRCARLPALSRLPHCYLSIECPAQRPRPRLADSSSRSNNSKTAAAEEEAATMAQQLCRLSLARGRATAAAAWVRALRCTFAPALQRHLQLCLADRHHMPPHPLLHELVRASVAHYPLQVEAAPNRPWLLRDKRRAWLLHRELRVMDRQCRRSRELR